MTQDYVAGACNIGPAEIALRRRVGHVGLATTAVLAAALIRSDLPRPWRLTLALPATVHNARAEDLDLTVDIVTARACAPLPRLLGYARPYLKRGATAMFLKGQDVVAELDEATKSWKFQSHLRPSLSNPTGHILVLEGPVRER